MRRVPKSLLSLSFLAFISVAGSAAFQNVFASTSSTANEFVLAFPDSDDESISADMQANLTILREGKSRRARRQAARELGQSKSRLVEVHSALLWTLMHDTDLETRHEAELALRILRPRSYQVVSELMAMSQG